MVTPESCQGYGNGTITIMASYSGSGSLIYSIDGGATYQGVNTFNSLSPAVYNVVVKVQGENCQTTGTATVTAGAAPTTWYKDLDGDGYTDGITATACSAPTGYVASAQPGDCNDNNASIHPGATEICDGIDNNCDGTIPPNEADNDADGFRVCDGDCNDNNPAINPGATEICNGIDDDCDGQIDEGTSGNQVYVGNAFLTSQTAVNNWSSCYYKIQGNLTIQGTSINSLAPLMNIQEVTGNVTIKITGLPNLVGLNNLTTIGGTLNISLNNYGAKLSSLSGLDNLNSIGANLLIYFNFSLSDCCSIDNLLSNAGVGGATSIHHNAAGCNSVGDIGNSCGGNSIIVPDLPGIHQAEASETPRLWLFPNPATTDVTIYLEGFGTDEAELTVFDQLGRKVLMQPVAPEQNVIELNLDPAKFKGGVYLITVNAGKQHVQQRLVIRN